MPDTNDDEFSSGSTTAWAPGSVMFGAPKVIDAQGQAIADLVRALDVPADGQPHTITIQVLVSPERVIASYVRLTRSS